MRATSQAQADVKCLALFTGEGLQDMETGTELIRQEGKVVNDRQPPYINPQLL